MSDLISSTEPTETPQFPPKPVPVTDNNAISKSVISIILFIVAFYYIFDSDIEYILMLVVVVLIHEAGHFAAMKYFNYTDVKMFFIPLLGAMVTGEKREISQWQRAIILIAGPFPGIVLGIVCYIAGIKLQQPPLVSIGNIFVFLNVFNLIPVKPFDGGNLLETLFFSGSDTLQKIFMVLSGIALTAFAFYSESYILLLLPFVFITSMFAQSSVNKIKTSLAEQGVDYNKPYEELTDREYWLTRDAVVSNIRVFKKIPAGVYTESANEKQLMEQVKALAGVTYISDMGAGGKALFVVLWLAFIAMGVVGFSISLLADTHLFKSVF